MTRYPGADWLPISRNFTDRKRARTDGIVLHSAASDASSLRGFFNRAGVNASSHLYVTKAGRVEQYVDLDKIAWTSGAGNARTIGIETEGVTGARPNEPFTDAQIKALVEVLAWLARRYDVPVRAMQSSRSTERGIGWHRLGVRGNFPALPSPLAGITQRGGGESWSGVVKTCPGDARILQIVEEGGIIEQVAALVDEDASGVKDDEGKVTKPSGTGSASRLVVDGLWGKATTRRLQAVLGTPVDGVLSHQWRTNANKHLRGAQWDSTGKGSPVVRALQRKIGGVKVDGLLGPATIRRLQARYGTPVDGEIWAPSKMVRALQRRLNNGKV